MATKKKKQHYTLSSDVNFGEMARDEHIVRDMWWLVLVKGIALLLLGFFALLWPGITIVVFGILFASYLLVMGIIDIVVGIRSVHERPTWFLQVLLGVLELVAGVYILDQGALLAVATIILLVGVFFIFQGVIEIVNSFRGSKDLGMRFWMIFGGLIGIIAGMVTLRQPAAAGLVFMWIIGFYGIFAGALTIAVGLSLRPSKVKAKA